MPAQDDVHVGAEHTLGHLHGDVPGHVLVLQPVDESYRAGDGDGALKHAVVLCLPQEVHRQLVGALFTCLAGEAPHAFVLTLLTHLSRKREGEKKGKRGSQERIGKRRGK